jgi:hypothetical protein
VTTKATTESITVETARAEYAAAVTATAAPAARTRRIRAKMKKAAGGEGAVWGWGLCGGDDEPSPAMQPCLPKEGDLARALHKQDYPTCQPSAPPQGSEDHKYLFGMAAIVNQLASMKTVLQTILLGVFGRYFVKKKHMNMLSYLNGSCNVPFFIECVNV